MPKIDGEEVLRELKTIQSDMCVLLITAYAEQEVPNLFRGGGNSDALQKAVQVEGVARKGFGYASLDATILLSRADRSEHNLERIRKVPLNGRCRWIVRAQIPLIVAVNLLPRVCSRVRISHSFWD